MNSPPQVPKTPSLQVRVYVHLLLLLLIYPCQFFLYWWINIGIFLFLVIFLILIQSTLTKTSQVRLSHPISGNPFFAISSPLYDYSTATIHWLKMENVLFFIFFFLSPNTRQHSNHKLTSMMKSLWNRLGLKRLLGEVEWENLYVFQTFSPRTSEKVVPPSSLIFSDLIIFSHLIWKYHIVRVHVWWQV